MRSKISDSFQRSFSNVPIAGPSSHHRDFVYACSCIYSCSHLVIIVTKHNTLFRPFISPVHVAAVGHSNKLDFSNIHTQPPAPALDLYLTTLRDFGVSGERNLADPILGVLEVTLCEMDLVFLHQSWLSDQPLFPLLVSTHGRIYRQLHQTLPSKQRQPKMGIFFYLASLSLHPHTVIAQTKSTVMDSNNENLGCSADLRDYITIFSQNSSRADSCRMSVS